MRTSFARFAISVGALAFVAGCHGNQTDAAPPTGESAAPSASAAPDPSAAAEPWSVTSSTFPIPQASVDLVLNPQGVKEYDGPTGSVEGTIKVTGPAAPVATIDAKKCPAALDTYGKLFREGTPDKPGGARALGDAVVVAVGYSGFVRAKDEVVHLNVGSNCAYPARTIAVTYGQRIDISNQTKLLFAPYIEDIESVAVMVAPPLESGEPVKLYPRKAGRFVLVDQMEPFVREDLYVFRHPFHAVSNAGGYYRIDGIPVGTVKIGVHHPAMDDSAEMSVEVTKDTVQKVDLTLKYVPKVQPKVDAGAMFTTRCLRWLDPATKKKCAEYDRPND
jgi:hypothetical protein